MDPLSPRVQAFVERWNNGRDGGGEIGFDGKGILADNVISAGETRLGFDDGAAQSNFVRDLSQLLARSSDDELSELVSSALTGGAVRVYLYNRYPQVFGGVDGAAGLGRRVDGKIGYADLVARYYTDTEGLLDNPVATDELVERFVFDIRQAVLQNPATARRDVQLMMHALDVGDRAQGALRLALQALLRDLESSPQTVAGAPNPTPELRTPTSHGALPVRR